MSTLRDAIQSLKWAADGEFSARITPTQSRLLLDELEALRFYRQGAIDAARDAVPLPEPSTVPRVAIEKGIGGGTREVRYTRSCIFGHELPASFAGLYCPSCHHALVLKPA